MKKTLARLAQQAEERLADYDIMRAETSGKSITSRTALDIITISHSTIEALYNYARTLEDAYSEFAEDFDKKLEKMEKALENLDKPVQKKKEKKKISYIK